jgi:S1-C subfamily serine protease
MRVRSSAGGRAADSVSRRVRSDARAATCMTLAVVSVALLAAQAQAQVSTGTAFAASKDGDLVTNDHVISGCGSVEARLGSRMFWAAIIR